MYRVDKFVVPEHARDEFLAKVRKTHEFLKTLPGFLQDLVLERSSGPGEFNFATIVEWGSFASIENAKAAVMAMHREMNFNPQETFARLGIKADLANYRQVDANPANPSIERARATSCACREPVMSNVEAVGKENGHEHDADAQRKELLGGQ